MRTVLRKAAWRTGFTLMEVNLAILVMAVGSLAMISLYSLGFRETRQSEEDVAGTGYADAVFAPLVNVLSATNLTWSTWKQIGEEPSSGSSADSAQICDGLLPKDGWSAYVQQVGNAQSGRYRVQSGCRGIANNVFSTIAGKAPSGYSGASMPSLGDYYYALVATRKGATISLAFRASRRLDMLMSQPVYYTEVHFQGEGER